jgi:ribose/xylose/arabinose/galactoside ABC-type transport system permease subunit
MRTWAIRLLENASWLLAGAILLAVVLSLPAFQRGTYWFALSRQYFTAAALALALTPIILTGGIDLSVGSVTVFSSVVIGALWREAGWPITWAAAGGVAAGLLAGLGNALLVRVGVIPLVATLATRELFRGLARTLSGDVPVRGFPEVLEHVWMARPLGLPTSVWALAALFVITYAAVHHTWVGRMLYALGDNARAAHFAGVPVGGLELGLYAWSGLIAGLCGVAQVMESNSALADAEPTLELVAIACVVMGGVRITGGSGHVVGALLGIVTVVALLAGLLGISSTWRATLTGAMLLVVAIANETALRAAERLRASYNIGDRES